MVQVDLPAAFAIGQVFAYLSRDYLKKDPSLFTNRALGPFNFYMACCYAPVGMFLLVGWPAWEIMYLGPWLDTPFNLPWVAGFYVLFGIVMVLLGNVGFILAHRWLRRDRAAWVKAGITIGAGLTLLPFLLRWGIWMKVGNFAEVVEQQAGYSFWDAPFFHGWAVIMSYMVITTVAMGIWMRTRANKMQP